LLVVQGNYGFEPGFEPSAASSMQFCKAEFTRRARRVSPAAVNPTLSASNERPRISGVFLLLVVQGNYGFEPGFEPSAASSMQFCKAEFTRRARRVQLAAVNPSLSGRYMRLRICGVCYCILNALDAGDWARLTVRYLIAKAPDSSYVRCVGAS